ncbi:hypothetical protein [Nannocystis pusilla]|uniref:Uncharacterized protein n=1 Tax=Nannocystis pusilla TaxID=889268 RepID=A0ABS7U3S9_9BACT|nr:hypothetical protein [Nannocystis pusilla]MBZ5715074.1 hypothetical protein [Nannocystis pusilla]
MHLTEATILSTRANTLALHNAGPTVSTTVVHGALVSGQSVTTTVPIVTPKPPKAIFSIVSWNIQDYKGSKIDKGRPFVHAFIKRLVEALKIDLLLLIETDIDLDKAVARIELQDHGNFGSEHPTSPCDFHLVGSGRAFKKMELPQSFTLDDLQQSKMKITEDLDWTEEIEAFFPTYAVTYDKKRVSYPKLKQLIDGTDFRPEAAEFVRTTACPTCAGAGCECGGRKTCLYCTCTFCKGTRQRTVFCRDCTCRTCHEERILRWPCSRCGSEDGNCMECGGRPVEQWCPTCHCVTCVGEGERQVTQQQQCPTCNGARSERVTCPLCQGRRGAVQPCPECAGPSSMDVDQCERCGGTRQITVACAGCAGQGQAVRMCQQCAGGGTVPVTVTVDCSDCDGLGYKARLSRGTTCERCSGTGRRQVVCGKCRPARCPTCDGAGEPSANAWNYAVETASLLLQTKVFAAYDVETYAAMWRTPPTRLASKFGVGHEACDRKLAWLCTGASLCSTDPAGKQLGFQDVQDDINGRSPFVMSLWLSLGGKHVQLPIAALHALWEVTKPKPQGQKKKKATPSSELARLRGLSVERMLDLAVEYPGAAAATLGSFDNPLLVGDLNLDYSPGKRTGETRALQKFLDLGYATSTRGTKTSLATLEAGLAKLEKAAGTAQLYSAAYDHFLMKVGSDLEQHVVQSGVIDILDLAKRIILADPQLAGDIDADASKHPRPAPRTRKSKSTKSPPKKKKKAPAPLPPYDLAQTKDPDLARAFYLYRKYVSDHVPVLVDILVDTQSAEQAALHDRMILHGSQLGQIIDKKREQARVPGVAGHWTELKFEFTGDQVMQVAEGGREVLVSGMITRWAMRSLTVRLIETDKTGQPTGAHLDFHGTHTIDPEILRDFKQVGITWLTGTFTPTPNSEQEVNKSSGTAEPPLFWRP